MNNMYNKAMMLMTLIFFMTLLTACATTTPHGVITESNAGEQTADIDCSGKNNSLEGCYKVAASVCPDGYTVVSNQWLMSNSDLILEAIPSKRSELRGINIICKGKMDKGKLFWKQELDEMGGA